MIEGRPLVVSENVSANGVIEFLDPWFDPGGHGDTDDLMEVMRAQMANETSLILGRQTFEDFRGFWPLQEDDKTGIHAHLNQVPKYVVSSTLTDLGWENSTVIPGPLVDEVKALKAAGEGAIGVTGSISVVHALLAADLVDEVRLFVYPVLSSRGRNLVPEGLSLHHLALQESRTFRSGVVLLSYGRG